MLFPSYCLNKNQENEHFLNVKKFFKEPASDTIIKKVASVVFLIYAFILDVANIAKKPFRRKVVVDKSNSLKKYIGCSLLAFSAASVLKKYLIATSSSFHFPEFTKNALSTLASSSGFNELIFASTALVFALALNKLRLKAFKKSTNKDASSAESLVKPKEEDPKATSSTEKNSPDSAVVYIDSDIEDDGPKAPAALAVSANDSGLSPPRATSFPVIRNIEKMAVSNAFSFDGQSLADIMGSINKFKDYIFFWKMFKVRKEHEEWTKNPPINYLDAKQIGGGSVFVIDDKPNLIFKLCRHTIFGTRGKPVTKSEQERDEDINSGLLIDVKSRMENIQRCQQIINIEELDSIILPKTSAFNYPLQNEKGVSINFPILVQEKLKFEKSGERKLTLYEALETGKVSAEAFRQLIKFLLISGFEDVRMDNIFIIKENGKCKIGLIDFDKLDKAKTAILGSKETVYEEGLGEVQKIPGLLSERVIPMGNNKYLNLVKTTITELKDEHPELGSKLTEIETEINQRFQSH